MHKPYCVGRPSPVSILQYEPVFSVPGKSEAHSCMGISREQPPSAVGYLCCPNKAWCSMSAAGKAWIWDFGPESKSDLAKCRECDFLFMTIREERPNGRARDRKSGKAGRKRGNSDRSNTSAAEVVADHVQPTPKSKAHKPKRPPSVDEVLEKLQVLTQQGLSFEDAANEIRNPVAITTTVEPNADELEKFEN